MPSTTVRVDVEIRDRINSLAKAAGITGSEVLVRALEAYEDRAFWNDYQAAAVSLRADPDAWAAEQAERAAWERTSGDGLA